MFLMKRVRVRSYEAGLVFRGGEFRGLLEEGVHWLFDPLGRVEVDVVSLRAPGLAHEKLDLIVKSGVLEGRAIVLDLKDHQAGLAWVDGRFSHVLPPGLYAYWTGMREVRVEVVDTRRARFEHEELATIARSAMATKVLEVVTVGRNATGVLFLDGHYAKTLEPGLYAFWKGSAEVKVVEVDLREAALDVAGQEIMTLDKVTLRLNAVVTYRVADPRRSVTSAEDARQALYREVQLGLRAVVGLRELDALLADKESLAGELLEALTARAGELGLAVTSAGVRDIILPGEMKELMNKVTEARKAAEANLITRREETAALRSQANTAKLLADHPMLMRLRELEVLEKVAGNSKLKVVLGEQGLAERIVNLI
jgi:regulator of protease activity HflC (stomatin/prohibitin superfamily)